MQCARASGGALRAHPIFSRPVLTWLCNCLSTGENMPPGGKFNAGAGPPSQLPPAVMSALKSAKDGFSEADARS